MCDPRELEYIDEYTATTYSKPDFSNMLKRIQKTKAMISVDNEMKLELIRQKADNCMLLIKQQAYANQYTSYTDLLNDIVDNYLRMESELNEVDQGNEDFYSQHQNVIDEIYFQFKRINNAMKLYDGDMTVLHEDGIPYIISLKSHS